MAIVTLHPIPFISICVNLCGGGVGVLFFYVPLIFKADLSPTPAALVVCKESFCILKLQWQAIDCRHIRLTPPIRIYIFRYMCDMQGAIDTLETMGKGGGVCDGKLSLGIIWGSSGILK